MCEVSEGAAPPAGGGRRLTLAPRPWASKGGDGRQSRASLPLFADSGGGEVESGADKEEDVVWSGESSVGSWSASRRAHLASMGSRFWALAAEDSSDEETSPEDSGTSNGVPGSCAGGAVPASEGVQARPVASGVPVVHGGMPNVQSKSLQRRSKTCRPWVGPLPPPRCDVKRSLGDLWITDRRSGGRGPAARFADWCCVRSSPLHGGAPEAGKKGTRRDPVSNRKAVVLVPVRLRGEESWAVVGRGRAERTFRGLGGLGLLFSRAGTRNGSCSSPPPCQSSRAASRSSAPSNQVSPAPLPSGALPGAVPPSGSPASMAARPWEGRGV
jgi:hypothetical protein